jgi:hypothetical protein
MEACLSAIASACENGPCLLHLLHISGILVVATYTPRRKKLVVVASSLYKHFL